MIENTHFKCNADSSSIGTKVFLCSVKKYVYETIDGKRKRVSPFKVNEFGQIVEIKKRALNWVVKQ